MKGITKRDAEERLLVLEGQIKVLMHFVKEQGVKIKKLEGEVNEK